MSFSPVAAMLDLLMPVESDDVPRRAYALLDAARNEEIYPAILGSDCNWLCLYRGNAALGMAEVAPYLVELSRYSLFTRWLLENASGESWGIFLNAPVPIELLQNHFRRFILVQLPDGRTVYFRFYDPRVLRLYLPTCNREESAKFFGPVQRFVIESENARTQLTFDYEEAGVKQDEIVLL